VQSSSSPHLLLRAQGLLFVTLQPMGSLSPVEEPVASEEAEGEATEVDPLDDPNLSKTARKKLLKKKLCVFRVWVALRPTSVRGGGGSRIDASGVNCLVSTHADLQWAERRTRHAEVLLAAGGWGPSHGVETGWCAPQEGGAA